MKYNFRNLQFADAKSFIKIIEKTKITKRVNEMLETSKGDDVSKIGQAVVAILLDSIVENYEEIEQDLAIFYSDLIGITPDEFLKLDIDEAFEIIISIREVPNFKNFLNIVQKLQKKE